MKDNFDSIGNSISESFQSLDWQLVYMGVSIFLLNLLLMLFVCFYWVSQPFHSYVTGKPL